MKNLEFFNVFNAIPIGSKEHAICKVIIRNINRFNDLTIDLIANDANVSHSSVTRFVKKLGYPSFNEFKYHVQKDNQKLRYARLLNVSKKNDSDPFQSLLLNYDAAINNLKATKENLDLEKLLNIIDIFKSGKNIYFIGDTQDLACFKTVQMDLLSYGIPAYLINLYRIENYAFVNAKKEIDVIVFLSVFDEWHQKQFLEGIEKAKSKQILTICFSQDDFYKDKVELFYQYGIKNTLQDGYTSLFFLSRIISELIVF